MIFKESLGKHSNDKMSNGAGAGDGVVFLKSDVEKSEKSENRRLKVIFRWKILKGIVNREAGKFTVQGLQKRVLDNVGR